MFYFNSLPVLVRREATIVLNVKCHDILISLVFDQYLLLPRTEVARRQN